MKELSFSEFQALKAKEARETNEATALSLGVTLKEYTWVQSEDDPYLYTTVEHGSRVVIRDTHAGWRIIHLGHGERAGSFASAKERGNKDLSYLEHGDNR